MQVTPGLCKDLPPCPSPPAVSTTDAPSWGRHLLTPEAQALDHLQPTLGHTFLSQRSRRAQGTHTCQSWACSTGRPPAERSQEDGGFKPVLGILRHALTA